MSAVFIAGLAQPALPADKTSIGALVVEKAWARASVVRNGAAYITIRNDGKAVDRLVGVGTPVAKRAELHTVTMRGGIMRMHPLKAIEIHPGEPAVMRPGGNHVMLMGLKQRLVRGQGFPLTLQFEKAGKLTVSVQIMGAGARGMKRGMGHGQHKPTH
ncbi:MAG: copper chaperone PCu(A)C [Alphaproteobacteria bacterium]